MGEIGEILYEYLNHEFNPRDFEFWDREAGVYHATDTGKCLRQVYYEFKLGGREHPEAYPHFHLGNLTEDCIEEALTHHHGRDNIKNSFRVELEFGEFKVVGQTDSVLLCLDAQPMRLFEVKSTKWLGPRREEPSEHHVYPVQPYIRHWILILASRSTFKRPT